MGKSWVSLLKVKLSWRSRWIARVGIRRTKHFSDSSCLSISDFPTWSVDLDEFLDEIAFVGPDHHSPSNAEIAVKP